jgi:hypothetical protein
VLRFCLRSTLLLALLVNACGKTEEEPPPQTESQSIDTAQSTAYGSLADVSAYLEQINPHILQIGTLQMEYEEALASAKQGTADRRGTGHNLAVKAAAVEPGFQAILEDLEAIQPPPLLAPFHRDTRKMLTARIEALTRTMEGWDVEQQGGDFEAVYRDAEAKYEAANQLILQLNTQMNKINVAVQEVAASG